MRVRCPLNISSAEPFLKGDAQSLVDKLFINHKHSNKHKTWVNEEQYPEPVNLMMNQLINPLIS